MPGQETGMTALSGLGTGDSGVAMIRRRHLRYAARRITCLDGVQRGGGSVRGTLQDMTPRRSTAAVQRPQAEALPGMEIPREEAGRGGQDQHFFVFGLLEAATLIPTPPSHRPTRSRPPRSCVSDCFPDNPTYCQPWTGYQTPHPVSFLPRNQPPADKGACHHPPIGRFGHRAKRSALPR